MSNLCVIDSTKTKDMIGFSFFLSLDVIINVRIIHYINVYMCSVASDSVTSWPIACQAPLSIEFPRQEYWSGLPFSSSGDLPDPEIKPASPALHVDSLPLSHQRSTKLRYLIAKKC